MSHTRGPWCWYTSNSYRRLGTAEGHQELMYPVVYRDGHPGIEFRNQADATLIAAAPDLLEALEDCERLARALYLDEPVEDAAAVLGQCLAAIRKARGAS